MVQNVFPRYEKKYLLTEKTYRELRRRLLFHMQEDAYGLHTIRNLYFDTENDELIRNSIEKPVYKEKFRVRCYGKPGEDAEVFLEIKKKYQGVVTKRRAAMTGREARAYLGQGIRPLKNSQILSEIDYFLQFYQVMPKLYLAYDRIALFGKEDAQFRVTFDWNIRSRWERLDLADDTGTTPLLEEGTCLMEVKTEHALPLWFVKILSELGIRNISFSKYGKIYQQRQKDWGEKKGAA